MRPISTHERVIMERSAWDIYYKVLDIATHPRHSKWLIPVLLLGEAALCGLIIRTVPYTEIDWRSYMQQVDQYIAGEEDYLKIKGDTGPLVYPALHVYIYRGLHAITNNGTNIVLAQVYFSVLYLINLGLAMACYSAAKAPPYIYPMLVLSKRLHSIYLLRCFNDCFAMTALFAAIYSYQKKEWTWGSFFISCGVAIKMNMILVIPAVGLILYQALGFSDLMMQASVMFQVQLLLGLPFLRGNWKGYLMRAFDFRRVFLYEWTVNWRFVKEELFLSRQFAIGLLVVHGTLLLFFATTRWLKPLGRSAGAELESVFRGRPAEVQKQIKQRMTPEYILTTILTSNAIGMLCARSLHYQFFSWIAWATPFLLHRAQLAPLVQYFLWSGQELAWNKFPSTDLSSKIVVGVLAVTILEVWLATDDAPDPKKISPEELRKTQPQRMAQYPKPDGVPKSSREKRK